MGLSSVAILGGFAVDVKVDPEWSRWFESLAEMVEGGIVAEGDPSNYALVWEFGNQRQYKKGPKTVRGVNPLGKKAWLSSQASHGWISINEPLMWDVIDKRYETLDFDSPDILKEIKRVAVDVLIDIYNILQNTVPMDSGDLSNSLEIVEPDQAKVLEMAEDIFQDIEDEFN